MSNAIPEIWMAQASIYHSKGFLINRAIYNIPARMKAIPPTISCFHDINKIISKINTGMLCINNPSKICQKLNSGEKTSNDISAKNSKNMIVNILGVQYNPLLTLLVFFTLFFIYVGYNPGSLNTLLKRQRIKTIENQ